MIKHARLTVMVLGLLFAAGRADATTLTFDFTGTVLSNDFNPFGITDLSGTPVTGSFSYDTGTADSDADPTRGTYLQQNVMFTFTFASGATVTNDGEFIVVAFNDVQGVGDAFQVGREQPALVNGVQEASASAALLLADLTETVFSSDALPATLILPISRFAGAHSWTWIARASVSPSGSIPSPRLPCRSRSQEQSLCWLVGCCH
jgi:hypothetical protein